MPKFKKSMLVLLSAFILAYTPSAFAACAGGYVETGCKRCGTLYLNKKPFVKTVTYTTALDGSCKKSTSTAYGSCGSC